MGYEINKLKADRSELEQKYKVVKALQEKTEKHENQSKVLEAIALAESLREKEK